MGKSVNTLICQHVLKINCDNQTSLSNFLETSLTVTSLNKLFGCQLTESQIFKQLHLFCKTQNLSLITKLDNNETTFMLIKDSGTFSFPIKVKNKLVSV